VHKNGGSRRGGCSPGGFVFPANVFYLSTFILATSTPVLHHTTMEYMMNKYLLLFTLFACGILWVGTSSAQSPGTGYHIIDSLRLGGEGGWDYLTIDTEAHRLYVSRGARVQVVDLAKRTIAGEIAPTPGVHGIALVPTLGRGYTSNGRDSSVTVFDLKTLRSLATVKLDARNPDAILYDAFSGRIFTFNGGSANATAIDAGPDTVSGSVPLGGKPEFAVTDGLGRIYVNIEDRNEVVVFDSRLLRVLNRWSLAPGEEPTGLAIDREHRRLFAVCGNPLMVVLDADAGKVLATVPIGEGTDGAGYDAALHLAFSSNGEGTLTVVNAGGPDRYPVVGTVVTRRGARTLTVDEKAHRIYTVTAKFGPPPAPTAERPRPRPTIEPGSVTLYIIGR